MIYGIPGFKLEKHVVERRNQLLADGGVEFVLNANVGEDISFDAIRGKHDAVLIATGVQGRPAIWTSTMPRPAAWSRRWTI